MTKIEMNSLAAKKIREALEPELAKDPNLQCRVYVDHVHGDHAHYGMAFDTKKPEDEVVSVQGLDLLVGPDNKDMIDGLSIKFLLYPEEGFKITNKAKGNHGDH